MTQREISQGAKTTWVCSIVTLESFYGLVQLAGYGDVIVVRDKKLLSLAHSLFQRKRASGILRRVAWLTENEVITGQQGKRVSKVRIEFGGVAEQRHRLKIFAPVRAIKGRRVSLQRIQRARGQAIDRDVELCNGTQRLAQLLAQIGLGFGKRGKDLILSFGLLLCQRDALTRLTVDCFQR